MSKRVVIVGAGVAGLTAADRLAESGYDVVVLERGPVVGGLARSFHYGDFVFDVGPHRFHTYDDDVQRFIEGVLEDDAITIGRRSGVWMLGRTFEWPLTLRSALRLPPGVLLSAARDLVSRRPRESDNFEDFIRARYGDTLYRLFFEPYTERFTGTPCRELSRNWALTSLQRALIDRGISAGSLASLARSALVPRPELSFLYPGSGGVGVFSERLAERARRRGATVLLDTAVDEIEVVGARVAAVSSGGRRFACDQLLWTGPLDRLCALLGAPVEGLEFLSLLLYNVRVDAPPQTPYQWCYFSDAAVPFSRISVPTLFNPRLAPVGAHGICAELPLKAGDERWARPDALADAVAGALVRLKLVPSARAILGVHVERIAHAYPLYTLDYQARLARGKAVAARFANVRLLGRSATFSYNNMDGSIAAALAVSRSLGTPG